jgi:hypothetical protein
LTNPVPVKPAWLASTTPWKIVAFSAWYVVVAASTAAGANMLMIAVVVAMVRIAALRTLPPGGRIERFTYYSRG